MQLCTGQEQKARWLPAGPTPLPAIPSAHSPFSQYGEQAEADEQAKVDPVEGRNRPKNEAAHCQRQYQCAEKALCADRLGAGRRLLGGSQGAQDALELRLSRLH